MQGGLGQHALIASWRKSFLKPSSLRRELSSGVPSRLTDTLSQVPEPRREPVATRTVYLLMTCRQGVRSAAGNQAGLAGCRRERMEKGWEVGRVVPRGHVCQAGSPWLVPCQDSPLELQPRSPPSTSPPPSPPSNLSSSCCLRGSASLQGGLLKVTPGNSASSVSTPLPLDSPANLLNQNA